MSKAGSVAPGGSWNESVVDECPVQAYRPGAAARLDGPAPAPPPVRCALDAAFRHNAAAGAPQGLREVLARGLHSD
jgi:hypothetical protein